MADTDIPICSLISRAPSWLWIRSESGESRRALNSITAGLTGGEGIFQQIAAVVVIESKVITAVMPDVLEAVLKLARPWLG